MEKKKWLWKRRSSERSPGETESSGSFSSHSERYSDEQDASRESPQDSTQSPEITSKASVTDDEVRASVKTLTKKLSAALLNVSAKEDLVKQHAKVAEEAVAGWEKAENEAANFKQQLETGVQQKLNLEVRISHLDGALKECVRQLRQVRDEQEKRISDAIAEKEMEWESTKAELEKQILDFQAQAEVARNENSASIDPKSLLILKTLAKENSFLKQVLMSQSKELEIMKVERELSTQAAETASKLQLESTKKAAKLEAECQRLQSAVRKSSLVSNPKFVAASYCYTESMTDSHSDSGERPHTVDVDTCRTSNVDTNGSELSCSDSWASALIAELDQFESDKPPPKNLATCSFEIDMMDDFLEMERLAALPDTKCNTPCTASGPTFGESISVDNPLRAELDLMIQRVAELEKKLEKMEAEKVELKNKLDEKGGSLEAAQSRTVETETKLGELERELHVANETKEFLEFQLIGMEAEARTMSANIDSLKADIAKERVSSTELTVRCQELENELTIAAQQNANSDGGQKVKQEDLSVAADKLAECQKTIASLSKQLKSLATLEDFLIDTSNIPGFSRALLVSGTGGEIGKLPSSDVFSDLDPSRTSRDKGSHRNNEESPPPSLSSSLANHTTTSKSKNGFGKIFSRDSK